MAARGRPASGTSNRWVALVRSALAGHCRDPRRVAPEVENEPVEFAADAVPTALRLQGHQGSVGRVKSGESPLVWLWWGFLVWRDGRAVGAG
jgi:hypothetical protein